MISNLILKALEKREATRKWSSPIRLSASGKCARAISYQHFFPDKMAPIGAQARLKFRMGDLVELELRELLKSIDNKFDELKILDEQEEVALEIEGQNIKGHIDGEFVMRGEPWILEIKSTNDFRFKQVLKGQVDYSYACQVTAYMAAKNIPRALIYYVNTNNAKHAEVALTLDNSLFARIVERWKSVLKATPDNLPHREYFPNSLGKLPWQCSYCPARYLCNPDLEMTFEDNKPVYITGLVENETPSNAEKTLRGKK